MFIFNNPEPVSGAGGVVVKAEASEQVKVEPKAEPEVEPEAEPAPKKRRGQAKSEAKVQKPKEEATSSGNLKPKHKW